jgi:hypothetical protein
MGTPARHREKAAGVNAIDAAFVFLELLIGDPERGSERNVTHPDQDSVLPDP